MTSPALDHAIDLMREAQRLLEADHPLIAAHLETVIGLAADRARALADGQRLAH
ncbi:MAG: hypothetical protein Q7J32_17740 [Sphingomonadaceae bacterium]|nr:hypothetical protein [Sphingomonadaceae bacterium]